MGAVAVLQPHDCLRPHQQPLPLFHHPSSPLKNHPQKHASSVNGPKPAHQARRKRNPRPVITPSKTTTPPPPPDSSKNLVMGQVKILRRGEDLPRSTAEAREGVLPLPPKELVLIQSPATEFFRSEPSILVNGFYAGSAAFVASPPPSSVPLPGFFTKRGGFSACDSATSDLRRILRLD